MYIARGAFIAIAVVTLIIGGLIGYAIASSQAQSREAELEERIDELEQTRQERTLPANGNDNDNDGDTENREDVLDFDATNGVDNDSEPSPDTIPQAGPS